MSFLPNFMEDLYSNYLFDVAAKELGPELSK